MLRQVWASTKSRSMAATEASSSSVDPERDWKTLLSYLPDSFEQLAQQHRVLNPQWPNRKVTTAGMFLRFVFLHVGADMPLRQTVATIAESGGPKVSQVWLHQKMRRARPYLAALVERLVADESRAASPERWAGYEVVCLDGSCVSGPGADGADLRMHGVLRLHDLAVRDIQVTTDAEGETLRRFEWEPDQLVIVDRGYANPPGIAWTVDHGADVLVRVNRGSLPLYAADDAKLHLELLDVSDWCGRLRGHRVAEKAVRVIHKNGRHMREIRGRLIGFRLGDKEAQDARERVRREHGSAVTQEQLQAAEYVVLFTTTPSARLSAARCIQAYRLRWQIELQWKRWKSICHFDKLPNYRDDTMLSWLTAKVLLGLILDRIGDHAALVSNSRALARQPSKLTSIVWPLIVSAILPLRLADATSQLSALADDLDALDPKVRLQVEVFRDRFFPFAAPGV